MPVFGRSRGLKSAFEELHGGRVILTNRVILVSPAMTEIVSRMYFLWSCASGFLPFATQPVGGKRRVCQ